MAQRADRVYTGSRDIARLERLVACLDDAEHVELTMRDGTVLSGVVTAKPSVQTFLDAEGNEGINAVLALDGVGGSAGRRSIWVDRISEVRRFAEDQRGRA